MSLWQRRLAMKQSWHLNVLTIGMIAVILLFVAVFAVRSGCRESKMERFAKERFAALCHKKWGDSSKCHRHVETHHKRCFDRTYFPAGRHRYGPRPEQFKERRYHICMLLGHKGYYAYLRAYNKAQDNERHRPAFERAYKGLLPTMPWKFKGE